MSCPGAELPGVHYLRGIADVDAIRAGLKPGARVVIIGGGYIGLETAATARKQGCAVTVLEMADRVMNRVVAPTVSDYFAEEHRAHGVDLKCNARVAGIESERGILRALCADGTVHEGDMIVAGVGALPNSELAADAGLACDDGIVVDEYCRTSDPAIYAAGDCTNHPSPHFGFRMRLESVDNAFEQAKAAALNMLDRPTVYDRVPWFWSDQFDHQAAHRRPAQGSRSPGASRRPGDAQLQRLLSEGRRVDRAGGRQQLGGLHGGAQADRRARASRPRQARESRRRAQRRVVMPRVVFIEPSGARREIDAPLGVSVMEVARQNGIAGIVARCGGACACATCHVYVSPSWVARLEPPEEIEEGMLETAWEPRVNSRLSCQIHLTRDLDGLEVSVPQRQC